MLRLKEEQATETPREGHGQCFQGKEYTVRKDLGDSVYIKQMAGEETGEALTGRPVHHLSEPCVAHCERAAVMSTSSFVRQVQSLA